MNSHLFYNFVVSIHVTEMSVSVDWSVSVDIAENTPVMDSVYLKWMEEPY